MPPPIFHLFVAVLYAQDKPNLRSCPDYFLGNISPDAVYMRDEMTDMDKKVSHFAINKAYQKDNVLSFFDLFAKSPFVLGYCLHVLTDIEVSARVNAIFDEHDFPKEMREQAYHHDMGAFCDELSINAPWKNKIFNLLETVQAISIPGLVTRDEMIAERDYILNQNNAKSHHNYGILLFDSNRMVILANDINDILRNKYNLCI